MGQHSNILLRICFSVHQNSFIQLVENFDFTILFVCFELSNWYCGFDRSMESIMNKNCYTSCIIQELFSKIGRIMDNEKHTLTWHTYPDHLRGMMREMMTSKDFADVTLVTNDKKTLKAHRNILSACSPFFKDILQMSIQSNHPMIYLKGIQFSEIESILQFMYLGEAKFYEERMNEFLCAVKDLEIKELSKEFNSSGKGHDHTTKEATEEVEVCINESTKTFAINDDKIIGDKAEMFGSYNGMLQTQADKQIFSSKYQCKQCDKTCSTSSSLWHHKKNEHEGVKYRLSEFLSVGLKM